MSGSAQARSPQAQGAGDSATPSDAVLTFVFMANLAAQEATGDSAASTSPERVLNRLKGSTESQTYLFPVSAGAAPLCEVSELGLPLIPAVGPMPELDFVGFIHISLPLLEETSNAEVECILDVEYLPMPGEDLSAEGRRLTDWMAAQALELVKKLGRSRVQVGVLFPRGKDCSFDPMAQSYAQLGFVPKHSEQQMKIAVPDNPPVPMLDKHTMVRVWPDYDICPDYLGQVLDLLTVASTDAHNGTLTVEPIVWTPARLADAYARLRDRRAHTLLVALIRKSQIVAMAELSRQDHGDPEVAEWTLTVTHRDCRMRGFAWAAKLAALRACAKLWPGVTRTYTSVAGDDPAMLRINQRLGAEVISTSEAWELDL
ncbi:GNAT family acetyltransferase [Corynebacterium phocae]|uniref:GNAT family acetyltransferase n=1 Tax=Corynebacterium phocae TaxID=161895 RepID=A0A1L7D6L3_9CORY|nr:GNAT family acetyltransferase [Corynebacterium phocae]KAA8725186.1 GNAT family acetyltransferase [Corynebacterium phocae]